MLHLKSSNGFENIVSLDVYSSVYSNTIGDDQFTPNFNSDNTPNSFYIRLIEQTTQKEYWSLLKSMENNFPRSRQFSFYLDDHVEEFHININTTGLFDYEIYFGNALATNKDDSVIAGLVTNGIALVHNDNWTNDYFQNAPSGVDELIIPTTISYNG